MANMAKDLEEVREKMAVPAMDLRCVESLKQTIVFLTLPPGSSFSLFSTHGGTPSNEFHTIWGLIFLENPNLQGRKRN